MMILAGGLAIALAASAATGQAQESPLTTSGSMHDVLLRIGQGKDVELVLANGKSYRGKLGAVGDHSVIVTEIAGKELFDALIRLEDVSAVELRVRGR